jgi:hypothetical protein
MDLHMASPAVAELTKTFSTDASLFSEAPAIYGLSTHLSPSVTFTRPSITKIADPVLVFSNVEYKPSSVAHAVEGWKGLVRSVEKEEGALSFTV